MGGEKHPDGASSYPASQDQMASYDRAREALENFSTPVLLDSSRDTDRLFVAAFDGTGNSRAKDEPERQTNVAYLHDQILQRQREDEERTGSSKVASGYVEGVGTQGGLPGLADQITGGTYESRLEAMYYQFSRQAAEWIRENPDADIRLAAVGFSRGAEQAAGFTRMVEERGIRDPDGAVVHYSGDGRIERVDYADVTPLRAPGSVVQAAMLYDPVGTGAPRDHDRRLAPSVVTGFQITAEDERRNLFQGTRILDPGMTADGRFLNVSVAGAHSNIGGSYTLDGLSIRSGNLGADFINSLSDRPLVEKREEPTDPARNVIHRSEDHQIFYRTTVFDRAGQRAHQEELAPPALCSMDCRDAMPRNEAMAASLTWRPVTIGPLPDARQSTFGLETSSAAPDSNAAVVERLLAAARDGDSQKIADFTRGFLHGDVGQAWLQDGLMRSQEAQARDVDAHGQLQQAAQAELQR